jgi:hypothetical protein
MTVAGLPTDQRLINALGDVEGWDSAEVCSVLGLSETNQRVLLHRALEGPSGARRLHAEGSPVSELSCQQIVKLVTDYAEDAMSTEERQPFEHHLTHERGVRGTELQRSDTRSHRRGSAAGSRQQRCASLSNGVAVRASTPSSRIRSPRRTRPRRYSPAPASNGSQSSSTRTTGRFGAGSCESFSDSTPESGERYEYLGRLDLPSEVAVDACRPCASTAAPSHFR